MIIGPHLYRWFFIKCLVYQSVSMSIQVARILTPCSVCSKRIGNPMKTKELLNITTILCLFTLLWVYNNLVMKLKQLQRFFFCQRLHLPQRNEFQNCQVGLILSDGKIISTGFDAALYFMHSTEKNYKTIKISPLINSNRHTKWPLPRAAFVSLADRNFPRVSSVQIFLHQYLTWYFSRVQEKAPVWLLHAKICF